jgi:hypothetical protein
MLCGVDGTRTFVTLHGNDFGNDRLFAMVRGSHVRFTLQP